MPLQEPLVAIIAAPGPVRDGLRALLISITATSTIALLDGTELLSGPPSTCPPDLALIDAELFGPAIGAALQRLRSAWPATRCLVLVEDSQQQALALASGVASVVLKGDLPANLARSVEQLIAATPPDRVSR
jgi:DNA-binding NarL/FixJ family response regulator